MDPWIEKLIPGEIPRFDSPKSIFLGRVMGKMHIYLNLLAVDEKLHLIE